MLNPSLRIAISLAAGISLATPFHAAGQSAASYPTKPVRVIIPFGPGANVDLVLPIYTDRLGKELGQSFVFDHRGGGDTVVGVTAGAKATPDGYTLFTATSTLAVNHWLAGDLQYDTLKDIVMISGLSRSNSVLAIHPSVPASNLKEFIAYAKANPGRINVASTATAAVLHWQRLMNLTGTRYTIVNYKGGTQAQTDFVAGNVQGFINNASNLAGFIKAGKVKGLAVGGSKRFSTLPDVPTFAEAGLEEMDPNNWIAMFGSSRIPRDIIDKLNESLRRAQSAPEVVGALDKQGLTSFGAMTVPQLQEFIRNEVDRLGKAVNDAGLKRGEV